MPASELRITSVPPGEAPLWVREKWVGLSLPLAQRKARALSLFTSGVLSGPRGFFSSIGALLAGKLERRSGFLVETQAAIAVLGNSSWRLPIGRNGTRSIPWGLGSRDGH